MPVACSFMRASRSECRCVGRVRVQALPPMEIRNESELWKHDRFLHNAAGWSVPHGPPDHRATSSSEFPKRSCGLGGGGGLRPAWYWRMISDAPD